MSVGGGWLRGNVGLQLGEIHKPQLCPDQAVQQGVAAELSEHTAAAAWQNQAAHAHFLFCGSFCPTEARLWLISKAVSV